MVENILLKVIAGALKVLATVLYELLDAAKVSMDSLVFNSGGTLSGLSLFKSGPAQNFLATFFNVFSYIALVLFIPIIFWMIFSIARAGESPQAKSLMKDRLSRVLVTMLLLYTMPELLTLLVKISNGFVMIFNSVGQSFLGTGGSSSVDIVASYVQDLSLDSFTIVDAFTALMLVGINIWMMFFYIIRDLTISFLFLIFPIIAIWYPFNKEMIGNWWKNMLGNVLAQPIQAFVLTVVLSLSNALTTDSAFSVMGGKTFAYGIYVMVAFASIIPMTGIIKGLIGLEGGVGAGSSRAGIGGAMGAIMMARHLGRNIGEKADGIKEGYLEKQENQIARTQVDKNLEVDGSTSSASELNKPLLNPKASSMGGGLGDTSTDEGKKRAHEVLNRRDREANKKLVSSVGSLASGGFMAVAGAALGGGIGASKGLAAVGYIGGSAVGGKATGGLYDRNEGIKEDAKMDKDIQDIQLQNIMDTQRDINPDITVEQAQELIDPNSEHYNSELAMTSRVAAENQYLGIAGEKLDGTKWQDQERQALMKSKRIQNQSVSKINDYFAKQEYVNMTPAKKSPEELMQINNASIYQDKGRSVVYTTNTDGSVGDILSVGAGNPYLSEPINNPVSFSQDSGGMPNDVMFSINNNAEIQASAYMETAYPEVTDTSTQEYIRPFTEKANEYKREMRHQYEDNLKTTKANLGINNMSIQTNQVKMEELIKREKLRQVTIQQQELAKAKEAMDKSCYAQYSRMSNAAMSGNASVDGLN